MRNPFLTKKGELLLFGKNWDFLFIALEREIKAMYGVVLLHSAPVKMQGLLRILHSRTQSSKIVQLQGRIKYIDDQQ